MNETTNPESTAVVAPRRIDALDNLVQDHLLISRVVAGFEQYLTELERGAADGGRLHLYAVFFREYADLIHHQKEERILFALLQAHGFAPGSGPLVFMRELHDRERSLLSRLVRDATCGGESGTALDRIVRTGREFCEFQLEHMTREDVSLYPAARAELTAEERDSLARKLERFDRERDGEGHLSWLIQLGNELSAPT